MMKLIPIQLMSLIAAVVLSLLLSHGALAQARPVAAAAKELVETLMKQGGRETAEELASFGGEAAVREVLESAAREGGERLVQKTTQYAVAHGPLALRALRPAPARMVSALDELSPQLVRPALHAAAREPQVIAKLVTEFGSSGLEMAARHPGVGARLVQTFGDDGVRVGRAVTTDQAIIVARHADDIARLAPAQRSGVLDKIARSPAAVLDFLEKHPRILTTAAGVGTVLALKDGIIGESEIVTGPDGKPIAVIKPGLIERTLTHERSPIRTTLNAAGIVLVTFLVGWSVIRLWSTWRLQRLRYAQATAAAAKSSHEDVK